MDIKLAQQLMALNDKIIEQEKAGGKFVEGQNLADLVSGYTKSLGNDAHPELEELSNKFNSIPKNPGNDAVNSLSLIDKISEANGFMAQHEVAKAVGAGLVNYDVAKTAGAGNNNRLKSFAVPVLDDGKYLS